MTFPCTRCGLCCKHIDKVPQLEDYHAGDGICFHYSDVTGCKIYVNRPDVCRIDEGYKRFFASVISKQAYYQENAKVCNELQQHAGMSEHYRVKL